MVLEKQILPFLSWLPGGLILFLLTVLTVGFLALLIAFLVKSLQNGPGRAAVTVGKTVAAGFRDLRDLSFRRMFAIARLAVKESLRRYVLVVFAVFAIIFLFAGWYLDVQTDNPGTLYISFVLKTTNFLLILLAIFLSAFSLPNDLKNRTIYTVMTKPVRCWEIVLGRILGFSLIGTAIIVLMCFSSYVFVRRGLDHAHRNDAEAFQLQEDGTGWVGRTTFESHHRHEFELNEDGVDVTKAVMGHHHVVSADPSDDPNALRIGPPKGALLARVPKWGTLQFYDRQGLPSGKGINVGKEWTYRGYIEGGTLGAAVWRFTDLDSRDYLTGLPIEMTIRVFRTYKGEIEQGILGSLEIYNPDPRLNDPAQHSQLDSDVAVKSRSISFTATEFTPESRVIPRKIEAQMLDGSWRTVDLYESLGYTGALDIRVRCDERGQYFGMAKTDLYIRAADNWFWANFVKSYITLWLQMVVVTSLGVMFSTFLNGPVALLATFSSIVLGFFSQTITDVATGKAEGGGPIEAAIRIIKQENLMSPLETGVNVQAIQFVDTVTLFVMRIISFLMPNFREYAEYGGMNTARFVAYGFDIPSDLMWQHVTIAIGYIVVATCAGYFFLRSKEVAA